MTKFKPEFDEALVTPRIKALWEAKTSRADTLHALHAEGFDITSHAVERIRKEHGWSLRPDPVQAKPGEPKRRKKRRQDGLWDGSPVEGTNLQKKPKGWQKSRGRNSPYYAGHISGGEARRLLSVDSAAYKTIRAVFQLLCRERGFKVKSEAPNDAWQDAKEELVSRLLALRKVMRHDDVDDECRRLRENALDIMCAHAARDALRSSWNPGPIVAREALGITTGEWHEAIKTLFTLIDASGVPFMMDLSPEQRIEMQEEWEEVSPIMARVAANRPAPDTEEETQWIKALKTMFTAGFSQYRIQRRRALAGESTGGFGSGSSRPKTKAGTKRRMPRAPSQRNYSNMKTDESVQDDDEDMLDADPTVMREKYGRKGLPPSLAEAWKRSRQEDDDDDEDTWEPTDDASTRPQTYGKKVLPDQDEEVEKDDDEDKNEVEEEEEEEDVKMEPVDYSIARTQVYGRKRLPVSSEQPPVTSPYVAYMRLHPTSDFHSERVLWVAVVSSGSLDGLRIAAAAEFPSTVCLMVMGIIMDGRGGEALLPVGDDSELAAYLHHVGSSLPTFSVQIVWQETLSAP